MHAVLRLSGVKLVMGSAGHGGRAASDVVVSFHHVEVTAGPLCLRLRIGCRQIEHLQRGWSSFVNPDGPRGPPKVLKKGIFWMSAKSQTPIVPMRFECSRQVHLSFMWDEKRLPLPGSSVDVFYGDPIMVPESFESSQFDAAAKPVYDFLRAPHSNA
jgi:hypothetical protein